MRACNDAILGLFDYYHTDKLYEVVIGGSSNQNTWIRSERLGDSEKRVSTPNILNCDEYRGFWLSWYDGKIAVGQGEVCALSFYYMNSEVKKGRIILKDS